MSDHTDHVAATPAPVDAAPVGDAMNCLDWGRSQETLGALITLWPELSADLRLRIASGVIDAMEPSGPDDLPRR